MQFHLKVLKVQTLLYDVKLSRRLKLINSSRADSHVNSLKSKVSGTVSVPIIRAMMMMMMGTEMVPETLDFNELTRLSAREEFINYKCSVHCTQMRLKTLMLSAVWTFNHLFL
jgi:hypothetical protein